MDGKVGLKSWYHFVALVAGLVYLPNSQQKHIKMGKAAAKDAGPEWLSRSSQHFCAAIQFLCAQVVLVRGRREQQIVSWNRMANSSSSAETSDRTVKCVIRRSR